MSKIRASLMRVLVEEMTIPVELAGEALGVGRSAAYAAIKNKEIPHIRIGRRIAVPTAPIRRMLGIEEKAA